MRGCRSHQFQHSEAWVWLWAVNMGGNGADSTVWDLEVVVLYISLLYSYGKVSINSPMLMLDLGGPESPANCIAPGR